jgi:DNA-binding NtrC family response regulator
VKNKLDVLIVDGSKDMLRSMANVLETAGLAVRAVMTGREAIQRIKECPHTGVVILNSVLPDKSGLSVLEQLKSTRCKASVIALSASKDIGHGLMRAGAYGFLEKPFAIRDLVDMCKEVLNGKKNRRQGKMNA